MISTFGGGRQAFDEGRAQRDQLAVVKFQFVNPDTRAAVDPSGPVVRVLREGRPVSVQALGAAEAGDHSYPLNPDQPVRVGLYRFAFLTDGLPEGLYDLEASGSIAIGDEAKTVLVRGQIGMGATSPIDDFLYRLRIAVMDDIVEQYQIDQPIHQWNVDELFVHLRDAVKTINTTGPRRTAFDLRCFPEAADHLVIDGGRVRALYARARFERANEATMSDGGHNLDIRRSDFYFQMAGKLEDGWLKQVQGWKRANPARTIGMGSSRVPLRVSRIISMLPNYSNFFSG